MTKLRTTTKAEVAPEGAAEAEAIETPPVAETTDEAAARQLVYQDQERRSFEALRDVLLDGTYYGPSHELKRAPLTEAQHGILNAIGVVASEWGDGDRLEGDA
jgi:hypothetical protein